jgi:hypothetical protein
LLLAKTNRPHERGAILVAALFSAFLRIYRERVADLLRIASNGTGILPAGNLHPDLLNRLASEAAKSARHVLEMCVRALDYVPPVDITFGEYLRALITADQDLVEDDDRGYRVAVVEAFRAWGIYPSDVRSLSNESLLWRPPEIDAVQDLRPVLQPALVGRWNLAADRREQYLAQQRAGARLHSFLASSLNAPAGGWSFGLALGPDAPLSIRRHANGRPVFEVHGLRPCRRVGPDGQARLDLVVELVQRRKGCLDPSTQDRLDQGKIPFRRVRADFWFRGGSTLVINPDTGQIRYCIRKKVTQDNEPRLEKERDFRAGLREELAARLNYGGAGARGPIEALHL